MTADLTANRKAPRALVFHLAVDLTLMTDIKKDSCVFTFNMFVFDKKD